MSVSCRPVPRPCPVPMPRVRMLAMMQATYVAMVPRVARTALVFAGPALCAFMFRVLALSMAMTAEELLSGSLVLVIVLHRLVYRFTLTVSAKLYDGISGLGIMRLSGDACLTKSNRRRSMIAFTSTGSGLVDSQTSHAAGIPTSTSKRSSALNCSSPVQETTLQAVEMALRLFLSMAHLSCLISILFRQPVPKFAQRFTKPHTSLNQFLSTLANLE